MIKLFALPLLGLAAAFSPATAQAPVPVLPINAPAEVAADLSNRWILDLSNGGQVVVQLRPDAARWRSSGSRR
jgi:hypothetical protein